MATVNVYTYYTHKLAHESMPKPKAARRRLSLPRIHPLLIAAVLVLLVVNFAPPAHPIAAFIGSAMALGLVALINKVGIRTQKVWRALNGMSLSLDDVEVLCGH